MIPIIYEKTNLAATFSIGVLMLSASFLLGLVLIWLHNLMKAEDKALILKHNFDSRSNMASSALIETKEENVLSIDAI